MPLALTVLQILALDIGTDLLPALALGAEPPRGTTMRRRPSTGALIDRAVLRRAFGVLGPAEAVVAMSAFLVVLGLARWTFGATPAVSVLAGASGATFAAVVLGQLANAFACRGESRWAGALPVGDNRLLLGAVAVELVLLGVFLAPPLAGVLGGSPPPPAGWVMAVPAVPIVVLADAADKALRHRTSAMTKRHSTITARDTRHGSRGIRGTSPGVVPGQELKAGHGRECEAEALDCVPFMTRIGTLRSVQRRLDTGVPGIRPGL
ncbi:cation transport ATPase-like protein [Promicromonospora sp. AC04]|nr:cation transport ATPase-like protein [Promicromonospora sp. AC04]